MPNFSPVFGPGLVPNERVLSTELNQLDADHVSSLNRNGGSIIGPVIVDGTGSNTGSLDVIGDGYITLDGSATQLNVVNGSTLTVDLFSLALIQGTLNAANVIVTNSLTVNDGTFNTMGGATTYDSGYFATYASGSTMQGTVTVPNGQTLVYATAGTGSLDFTGAVGLSGTVTISNALNLLGSATVDSFATHLMESGASLTWKNGSSETHQSGSSDIYNAGATFSVAGTAGIQTLNVAFLNMNGTFNAGAGTTSNFSGNINLNGAASLTANVGTQILVAGTLLGLSGSTAQFNGNLYSIGGAGGILNQSWLWNVAPVSVPSSGTITWTTTGVVVTCPIVQLQVTGGTLTGNLIIDLTGSGLGNTGAASYWDVSRIIYGAHTIAFKNGSITTVGLAPANGLITVVCSANNRVVAS